MFKLIIFFQMLILTSVITFNAYGQSIDEEIIGEWHVDFEKTMEQMKQNSKYETVEEKTLTDFVKKVTEKTVLTISESHIQYGMGEGAEAHPYDIEGTNNNEINLTLNINGKAVKSEITLFEDGTMNYQSEATSDMDSYIWTKK